MRNLRLKNLILAFGLVLATIMAMYALKPKSGRCTEPYRDDATISGAKSPIIAEVVSTELAREQGLSGRKCIPDSAGMLFVFETDQQYGIWMKEMKFAIDIVWLSADKRVIHIEENALPTSYPHVFSPNAPARYVVELKSGVAKADHISVGDRLNW